MKRYLKTLMVALMIVPCMMFLAACGGENDVHLAPGMYTMDRTYVGGVRQTSGVNFNHVAAMTFRVEGQYVFLSSSVITDWQLRHRIRDGYLELRELVSGSPWIRENGSAASDFTSTRVVNGEIVMRQAIPGQPVWETFWTLDT